MIDDRPPDGRPPGWLETLAAACLRAERDDCRLGDLSELCVNTHRRLLGRLGSAPAAGIAANLQYLGAALNVALFVRVVEPIVHMVESNAVGLLALELRERLMNAFTVTVRKFALPALLLLCGALLVNTAYEGWTGARQSEALLESAQRGKAEIVAQRISSFVSELERQIGWTAYAQFASLPVDQRHFDYVRLMRQVPAITALSQLDGEGREQLNVSRLSMDVVDSGKDRSKEPAFVQAKTGNRFIGPVAFRKGSEPYVTMSMPIAPRGGVVVAEVNMKVVWDTIARAMVGDGGYAYVVDGTGRLISHPDIALVLRQPGIKAQPQVQAALAGPSERLVEGRTFAAGGMATSVLSVSAAVPGLDWKVIVDVPAAAYEGPFRNSLIRSVAMAGLGLIAMVLGVVLAMRPVVPTRPAQA